jgi:hypothetical protein
MDQALRLLTVQFLAWTARAPRTYADTMAAWRTSCPRLPVWEDALDGGLVRLEPVPGAAMAESAVVLTSRGRALLVDADTETAAPA